MLKDIHAFILALRNHWVPLATGIGATAVSIGVGFMYENHAPWWVWTTVLTASVFISCFLAWRTLKRENDNYRSELIRLNTQSVAIKLHQIEYVSLLKSHAQIIYLEVIGLGFDYVRPEIFAVSVEEVNKGNYTLHMSPDGSSPPFGVSRDETHNVAAIKYDPTLTTPLRVLLPCKKITSDHYLKAECFKIKICAYGGSKEAELKFYFGMDNGALWARLEDSEEKVYSDVHNIIRKGRD